MSSVTTQPHQKPSSAAVDHIEQAGFPVTIEKLDDGDCLCQANVSTPTARALVAVEWTDTDHWGVYVDDGEGRLSVDDAREFAANITAAASLAETANALDSGRETLVSIFTEVK